MLPLSSQLKHPMLQSHDFLFEMSEDDYFCPDLVEQAKNLLISLCYDIEAKPPKNLEQFYQMSQATTAKFNTLAIAFAQQECEFDSMAQDNICQDMLFIAQVYGFTDAETEQLVVNRTW